MNEARPITVPSPTFCSTCASTATSVNLFTGPVMPVGYSFEERPYVPTMTYVDGPWCCSATRQYGAIPCVTFVAVESRGCFDPCGADRYIVSSVYRRLFQSEYAPSPSTC